MAVDGLADRHAVKIWSDYQRTVYLFKSNTGIPISTHDAIAAVGDGCSSILQSLYAANP